MRRLSPTWNHFQILALERQAGQPRPPSWSDKRAVPRHAAQSWGRLFPFCGSVRVAFENRRRPFFRLSKT